MWGDAQTSIPMATWIGARIPHMNGGDFGVAVIAAMIGSEDAKPIAGIVYHNYLPQYGNIDMSVATDSPRWLTKNIISEIMRYPFKQLKVRRITVVTPANRQTSVWRFLTKFGFRQEGRIRQGLGTKDAVIWGLLASEWASSPFNADRVVIHGKVSRPSSNAPRSHRRRKRSVGGRYRHGGCSAETQHAGLDGSERLGHLGS